MNLFFLGRYGPPHFEEFIRKNSIGKLNHARWTTTASRTLRLYVSKVAPSDKLKQLARFIMQVYIPSWFEACHRSAIHEAAPVFFNIVLRVSILPEGRLKRFVIEALQDNSTLAHPETILLAMLCDQDQAVNNQARAILDRAVTGLRQFVKPPRINFNATHYSGIVDFDSVPFCLPPLLSEVKDGRWPLLTYLRTPKEWRDWLVWSKRIRKRENLDQAIFRKRCRYE